MYVLRRRLVRRKTAAAGGDICRYFDMVTSHGLRYDLRTAKGLGGGARQGGGGGWRWRAPCRACLLSLVLSAAPLHLRAAWLSFLTATLVQI